MQHIQDPWLQSTSDVERERAVEMILTLLQTFRDNMLLTVGGVSSYVPYVTAYVTATLYRVKIIYLVLSNRNLRRKRLRAYARAQT